MVTRVFSSAWPNRATAWLNHSGWDAVNVAGGMGAWQREGRPLVGELPGIEPEVL